MFTKLLNLEPKRREAIINAALKEFGAKGYDDASTNVIAKEAGISKGLMFHYVNNKKDFFLFLHDYTLAIIKEKYFDLVDYDEKDIFERLRQTYLLKVKVMQQYPLIFEFIKVAISTESDAVKKELDERRKKTENASFNKFYGDIDVSKFREGLDVEKCRQLIFWAVGGYANQIQAVSEIEINEVDFEKIRVEFDSYLDELRKSFYNEK
ncbi:MAG: TetR family transcriptional regulator [Peptococcaceae bacterium BICA1-8]|nr:MAG: TetR family transcriptional regulator [Peptococcaceae bacterium BICA1-8]